jgi:hypothetical protein
MDAYRQMCKLADNSRLMVEGAVKEKLTIS